MNLFDFAPGREGYYGDYGGCFLPEILHSTIEELQAGFRAAKQDPSFWQEYRALLSEYSCRPTPVTYLANLSRELGGAQIYVKREDLNHTGSHKLNNVMGQGLLTKRLGKTRVIAETGAGQHGFATATMAASSRRRYLSVRQSRASSAAARVRLPLYRSSFSCSRSERLRASAVAPAKPATTLPPASLRTLRALALTMVAPIDT